MKRIFYLLFLIALAVSCSDKAELTANPINVKGNSVSFESNGNQYYPFMFLGKNAISLPCHNNCYAGMFMNGDKWEKPDTLFFQGRGHNEFQNLCFAKGQDNKLLLMEQPWAGNKLLSLTEIGNTDNSADIKNTKLWKKYDLSKLTPFTFSSRSMISLSDSTVLVLGAPYNAIGHIFSIINYKTQSVLPLEYWPEDGVKCDSLVKNSVYNENAMLFTNNKGVFLYQCDYERFLFLFTIQGNKIKINKDLYTVYPRYESLSDGLNYKPIHHNNPEKLTCAANNKNIYVLLTECDKEGNKLDEWNGFDIYGNIIEIYDWNGNKKKTLHLDKCGKRIMVSEDNKKLYLFEDNYDDKQVNVWSYDIASLK